MIKKTIKQWTKLRVTLFNCFEDCSFVFVGNLNCKALSYQIVDKNYIILLNLVQTALPQFHLEACSPFREAFGRDRFYREGDRSEDSTVCLAHLSVGFRSPESITRHNTYSISSFYGTVLSMV